MGRGGWRPRLPRLITRRVCTIAKAKDQRHDGRQIAIVTCSRARDNNIILHNAFADYIPANFQISWMTIYTNRSYTVAAVETGTSSKVLSDTLVQPFDSWENLGAINRQTQEWSGLESREMILSTSMSVRSEVTIIPNKKDRQFVFNGKTDVFGWHSANKLAWITKETSIPLENWSDIYIDFRVSRWGHESGPTAGCEGCSRRMPVIPIVQQSGCPEVFVKSTEVDGVES